MANKKFITTPIGTAVMPFLFKEDEQYGGFKVALRVDKETAAKFKAQLMDLFKGEEWKTKTPNIPITEDTRNEGMYIIKTASGYQPAVFDSKNRPVSSNTNVGGGSEVRVICEAHKWEVQKKEGIKLRLKQVQIIKLAEGGSSGFESIEDGYEAADSEEPSFETQDL
jgi:hypothetical protein